VWPCSTNSGASSSRSAVPAVPPHPVEPTHRARIATLSSGRASRGRTARVAASSSGPTKLATPSRHYGSTGGSRGASTRPSSARPKTARDQRRRQRPRRYRGARCRRFTIAPVTAKDFDTRSARSASDAARCGVWVQHRRRVGLSWRPARSSPRGAQARHSVSVPARSSRCARGAVQRRLLAAPASDRFSVTVEMDFDGPDSSARPSYRQRHPPDERAGATTARPCSSPRERADDPGRRRWRPRARRPAALEEAAVRAARGARGETSIRTPLSIRREGHVTRRERNGADRSHRPDRAPDYRPRGRRHAVEQRSVPALVSRPRATRPRPASGRLADRRLRLRVRRLRLPESMSPSQARRVRLMIVSSTSNVRRTGHGAPRPDDAVLRALKQAAYRRATGVTPAWASRATATSPRPSALPHLVCKPRPADAVCAGETAARRRLESLGDGRARASATRWSSNLLALGRLSDSRGHGRGTLSGSSVINWRRCGPSK